MPLTSKLGDFLDQLRTDLAARPALSAVLVTTGQTADPPAEAIIIPSGTVEQDLMAMGHIRNEVMTVEGRIEITRATTAETTAGSHTAAKAARDRALVLLAEIEDEIGDDVEFGGDSLSTVLTGYQYEDLLGDRAHVARVTFTIMATHHLTRT